MGGKEDQGRERRPREGMRKRKREREGGRERERQEERERRGGQPVGPVAVSNLMRGSKRPWSRQ